MSRFYEIDAEKRRKSANLSPIINNIHESRLNQITFVQRPHIHNPSKLLRSLIQPDLKFMIRARLWQAIIISGSPGVEISELDPTAWTQMLVGLPQESWPVCYAAAHCTQFDEIEGFGAWVEPGRFAVVDLELEVWWDPD